MNARKTMRGASPLGALIMAISITLIAIFGIAGWVGSYQFANHEAINPFLANTINAINQNQAAPGGGVFGTIINSTAASAIAKANATTGILGSVSAAASAAGSAFSFMGTITGFVNPFSQGNFVNVFVIGPLAAMGIPAAYAAFIGYAAVIAMLVLLVLSALLIFNLL